MTKTLQFTMPDSVVAKYEPVDDGFEYHLRFKAGTTISYGWKPTLESCRRQVVKDLKDIVGIEVDLKR